MMTPKQLQKLVVDTLDAHQAQDIVTIDIRKLTNIADYMVICSANSNRQVNALANHLITTAKKHQAAPLGVEEDNNGSWTLVDLNDVIVHIMLPETREFYNLEQLWAVNLAAEHRK